MPGAVVTLPGVDRHAGGVARVDPDELRAKLGHTAWHVWVILRDKRDHFGRVHITINGIARARGYVRITPRAAKKALATLRQAGLVRDVGFRVLEVPWRNVRRRRRVFMREVFGKVLLENRGEVTWVEAERGPQDVAMVPNTTAEWLTRASGWGGKRAGSGRKSHAPHAQEVHSRGEGVRMAANDPKAQPVFSSVSGDVFSSVSDDRQTNKSLRSDPAIAYPLRGKRAPLARTDLPSQLGTFIGAGTAACTRPSFADQLEGVPPYPGIALVPPARLPPPPLLDPDEPDHAKVVRLVKVYRGMVTKRMGSKASFVKGADKPEEQKWYDGLIDCAAELCERDIPPTSWALFSYDVHRKYGGKKGRPPLRWVWAASRVVEHSGWYRQEAQSYRSTRLVFGKRHLLLLQRYEHMRAMLYRHDDSERGRIVDEHFPRGLFHKMVADARAEAEAVRRRLEEDVARGVFLWR